MIRGRCLILFPEDEQKVPAGAHERFDAVIKIDEKGTPTLVKVSLRRGRHGSVGAPWPPQQGELESDGGRGKGPGEGSKR